MLLPQRHDDTLDVSPSSKSVVSILVIDSIDGIILDRPDSCNLFSVNCLYGHGIVQSTTLLNASGSETISANANLV
ncbi:hypothetical protein PVL29_019585 [Vitis rotundifolia]|uniref:Uncharacterized protein n=1 Tax=Vitis rotundifolia TaxID=103349 RepID=A0AA38Z1L8_VITRO|nr:hypothetical protein PVL29_019585 [Vitis rotundifolia]